MANAIELILNVSGSKLKEYAILAVSGISVPMIIIIDCRENNPVFFIE
jgi:hypothetical protein